MLSRIVTYLWFVVPAQGTSECIRVGKDGVSMSLPDTLDNIASSRAATFELYLVKDIVSVSMYGILLEYVPCTMYQVYTIYSCVHVIVVYDLSIYCEIGGVRGVTDRIVAVCSLTS